MEVRSNHSNTQTRLVSFNCSGFKSSKDYICNILLGSSDIVALQETWLLPHEVALPETLSADFQSFSSSFVNVEDGLLRGRPFGGLSFLWH